VTTPRRNVELKARYDDLQAGRDTAQQLGASFEGQLQQRDTYYLVPEGRLKLREIRAEPGGTSAELIWYARPDDLSARTSHFHVVPLAEPTGIHETLAAALGIHVVVEKTRELFLLDNVRIHLDTVTGLGRFLEFEALLIDGRDEQDGFGQLDALQRDFGIRPDDVVGGSYSDLLSDLQENAPAAV